MDFRETCPWDWEIVVVVQPILHGWAEDRCVKESGAEVQLFAAINREAQVFEKEPWILHSRR